MEALSSQRGEKRTPTRPTLVFGETCTHTHTQKHRRTRTHTECGFVLTLGFLHHTWGQGRLLEIAITTEITSIIDQRQCAAGLHLPVTAIMGVLGKTQ